jgi:pyruvate dehydrogenase (quinone)
MTRTAGTSVVAGDDAEQIKGFTLYATRSVLSGRGDGPIDLARTNVTRRLSS